MCLVVELLILTYMGPQLLLTLDMVLGFHMQCFLNNRYKIEYNIYMQFVISMKIWKNIQWFIMKAVKYDKFESFQLSAISILDFY